MSQIVGEINFDADEFIEAMRNALEAEVKKGGKSVDDRKKENEKEEKETMKRLAEEEARAKSEKELEDIKSKIIEFFNNNKTNLDVIKPVLKLCKDNSFSNPTEINDIAIAKKILAACK
jgi:hydroxylamine reductase (hybrid-cluster protein)